MKASALLKEAKKHLASTRKDKKPPFICIAIYWAAGGKDLEVVRRLWEHISLALGRDGHTMESWLMQQGVPEKELTFDRVQAHRREWLNRLIHEFEQAGD